MRVMYGEHEVDVESVTVNPDGSVIAQGRLTGEQAEQLAQKNAKPPALPCVPAYPERRGEHIEQFFAYEHLPPHLQEVSKPFGDLARTIIATLPRNPERTVALRKLLESKDAAVRAKLAKDA